ncbi:T9SS type A sorting domain-containing protein [Bacteroidota bacterium]
MTSENKYSSYSKKKPFLAEVLFYAFGIFIFSTLVTAQQSYPLTPLSGADGQFEVALVEGDTLYRALDDNGTYELYMYFKTDVTVLDTAVYLEVTFKDIGFGTIGIHYNSTEANYTNAEVRYNYYLQNTLTNRIAVIELKNADFRNAQNLGADLRLFQEGNIQMHILSVALYYEPPASFLKYMEDWISPYDGPEYIGENLVDASSLEGKVICGYQGWFRAAGDPSDRGWVHYASGDFSDLSVDMWPDMSEYSDEEKYPVPGWTYANGDQAYLFSSANKKTVIRHFQWMETYGIDGVAVQRFVSQIDPDQDSESFRIAGYAREAANRTGRTYFIMYDMSGDENVEKMRDDWHYLIDVMKISEDDRYLHQNGKPVVGIFGFYAERFDAVLGNQVLDIFQSGGKYEAFVVGSGEQWWLSETDPGWPEIFRRMDAWIPWNVGNYSGDYAQTSNWEADKTEMDANGVIYMPLVFPGFGWDNLKNLTPGTSVKSRLEGEFLWKQFLDAKSLGAEAVYVAMFDEIDESTAIFKITNDIPVNHYFQTLEGLPSDFYLLLTGFGTRIINGSVEVPTEMPDFAAQSQPPIPEIFSPVYGDTLMNPVFISWSEVQHTSGISGYELEIDGQIINEFTNEKIVELAEGEHTIRIRAVNGLDVKGGLSEAVVFFVQTTVSVDSGEEQNLSEFSLSNNYPNPFNMQTTIEYVLPRSSHVKITVYNILGQLVKILVDSEKEPGQHRTMWNGIDQQSRKTSSGIYFCRIVAGDFVSSRKLLLLK